MYAAKREALFNATVCVIYFFYDTMKQILSLGVILEAWAQSQNPNIETFSKLKTLVLAE
jgi:hypothetical protein